MQTQALIDVGAPDEGPIARVQSPALRLRFARDEQLVRLAGTGNAGAVAAIFHRYHPDLVRYCRSIVLNPHDAEDAAQVAMLKAANDLERRPKEVTLRPWLYRIAHNESIQVLRRRKAHVELGKAEGLGVPGPEHEASTRERLARLVEDLGGLSERQRGALLMRELSGLDYGEIAAALGMTTGAARQTVFQARSALVASARARDESCETVRQSVSDGDRRRRRGRRVRAHLDACDGCRTFAAALDTRRRDLAVLTGPATLPWIAGGGLALAGSSALPGKLAAAGAVLAVAGGGAVGINELKDSRPARTPSKPVPGQVAERPVQPQARPTPAPVQRRASTRRPVAAPSPVTRRAAVPAGEPVRPTPAPSRSQAGQDGIKVDGNKTYEVSRTRVRATDGKTVREVTPDRVMQTNGVSRQEVTKDRVTSTDGASIYTVTNGCVRMERGGQVQQFGSSC